MIEFLLRYSKRDGSMWSEEEWRVILEKCRQDLKEKIECYQYSTLAKLEREKEVLNSILMSQYNILASQQQQQGK